MSTLVADCPRCGAARTTLDVGMAIHTETSFGWRKHYEVSCICRNCCRCTIFKLSLDDKGSAELVKETRALVELDISLNRIMDINGFVNLRHQAKHEPPEHLPPDIHAVFNEAATCLAVECWNAAGAMFRASIDLGTRPLLPDDQKPGLNSKTRRDLGLRLPWLFENEVLPEGLRDLSTCIREDGNDGAHQGTLTKEEALDLLDFTRALLERIYTEPEKLQLAQKRRDARRSPSK